MIDRHRLEVAETNRLNVWKEIRPFHYGWVSVAYLCRDESIRIRASGDRSLDRGVFTGNAAVFTNHAHFLAPETCILDRHTEQNVFVLLVIGSKGVLVEQHELGVIRARFREVGELLPDGSDQAGLSLHPFVVGHRAMRIADPRKLDQSFA